MQYFKSERFLGMLYFVFILTVGCITAIIATESSGKWDLLQEKMVSAGYFDSDEDPIQTSEYEKSWIIRTYDERIGVFDATGKLEYIVNVYVFSLPQSDQELLKNGILVSSEKELEALMEDYTG